jgi:hypothetical protein
MIIGPCVLTPGSFGSIFAKAANRSHIRSR